MLIVEDGTALTNAESYVSASACADYAYARRLTFDDGDAAAEPALRRATAYIDAMYQARFPGYPLHFGFQALQWPRIGAYMRIPDLGREEAFLYSAQGFYYIGGLYYVPANVVPPQVIKATCEAAIREFGDPGSLAPDLERGNAIEGLTAGPVTIRYGSNASPLTVFQTIEQALSTLLMPSNPFGGRAVRG